MVNDVFLGIGLSLMLGALLGVEREIRQQKEKQRDFAGFRTYTFICLLGFLIGYMSFEIFDMNYIFPISLMGLFILVALSYWVLSKQNKNHIGLISQVVAILSFLIGILISIKEYQISIALSIAITTILFLGNKFHAFARHLKQKEIFATLQFAIMSLIVLPLLPNKNYTPLDLPFLGNILLKQNFISYDILAGLDVFNFYYLWLMVVFILGIAYVGYILIKTIGANRGILLTGFFGGLMSSTALTSSFSIESKEYKHLSCPLAIGVIIASSIMFFRVLFEVLILNPDLFMGLLFSLGTMGIAGIILSIYLYLKKNNTHKINKIDLVSPFSLEPALKFAAVFLLAMFITKLLTLIYGNSGIYLVAFISGIVDVDAITISLLSLAKDGTISNWIAQFGIIIASFANTIFKAGIAYTLGSKKFFQMVLWIFSLIILFGGITLILQF